MFTRSSFCRWDNPTCVEVDGLDTGLIKLRSSVTLRQVSFTRSEWSAFVDGMKAGEFDLRPQTDGPVVDDAAGPIGRALGTTERPVAS